MDLAPIAAVRKRNYRTPTTAAFVPSEKGAEDSSFQIAEAFAYRGEADRAFEWLERAYVQHDPGLSQMQALPLLRNLYGDTRWPPFLEKMRLAS